MTDCVFCDIVSGGLPATKIYEDDLVLAFFDRAPVAEYHTLVIPKRHATDIFDVDEEDLIAVMSAIRRICRIYREKLGIRDVQIVSSNGNAAQQDTFHLHFHIIPRAHGDGLVIPWSSDGSIAVRFADLLSRLNACNVSS